MVETKIKFLNILQLSKLLHLKIIHINIDKYIDRNGNGSN